jgi:lyso-ornithine lipid O-acyltransferase
MLMVNPPIRTSLPQRLSRTGSRAARVGSFALETMSRLLVEPSRRSIAARVEELGWIAENMCAIHGVRTIVRGELPAGPAVLVANHVSYFDPLAIVSLVPSVPVAKREVASWPVVGETCKRLGVQFVTRECGLSGARVLRSALRALAEDVSVLVFPEGTTTRGDEVLPFRRGIFGVAAHAGVPVVPVAIRYERADAAWVGDDAFLPHYVRTMGEACTRVSVEFLAPLYPRVGVRPEQLAAEARDAVANALAHVAPMPSVSGLPRVHARLPLAS